MPCPHANSCPLYAQFKVQSFLTIWKLNYCEADFAKCERFRQSSTGAKVPPTLLPNGKLLGATRG